MGSSWFRMYSDALDDPKLMFLSRADVGNYFLLLVLKSEGGLDQDISDEQVDQYVAFRLRLTHRRTLALKSRLMDAQLVDGAWQPLEWEKHCHSADGKRSSKERRK